MEHDPEGLRVAGPDFGPGDLPEEMPDDLPPLPDEN
jgi:hypothetical protein